MALPLTLEFEEGLVTLPSKELSESRFQMMSLVANLKLTLSWRIILGFKFLSFI